MRKRTLLFLILIVGVLSPVVAQHRDPASIVVKFKSTASIEHPSAQLYNVISTLSKRSLQTAGRIIPRTSNATIQTVRTDYGLDRIIVLPLSSGVTAEQAVRSINGFQEIEYVEPNYLYHIDAISPPNDSLYSQQWSHSAMDVLGAWGVTQGDSSVHIGFVDTGVEWDHPDLVGQFAVNPAEDINHNGLFDPWPSTEKRVDAHGDSVYGDLDGIDEDGNGYIDDVIGYDFVDQESVNFGDASGRDPIPQDEGPYSHGTAVAGVIAAKANNRIGVAGIAPKCRLVALRAFDATGNAESDDIASAIVYAADNGVKILNLSFGDVIPSMLQRDAIRYATKKGVLVIAASGNDGSDGRHYPSDFDECLSVGMTALDNTGREVLAIGSSHGEGMDLIAPGQQIATTAGQGGYQFISGTSFSSPAAAAVAGLLLSKNPSLSNIELRSILESTTDHLSASSYDHTHANGRINAMRAVAFVGSAAVKISSPNTDDGIQIDSVVTIRGSAASALFRSYSVSFAPGLNPDHNPATPVQWTTIHSDDHQVIDGDLGRWDTKDLSSGIYTLRLFVLTTDSRSIEERMTITLNARMPYTVSFSVDTMYQNEHRILLLQARSSERTRSSLYYKSFATALWSVKNDDQYTYGHSIILGPKEVQSGVPLDLKLITKTNSGDSVTVTATAGLPNEAISQSGFHRKSYTLPSGYLLDTVIATSQGAAVIESVAPSGSDFGYPYAYLFDKQTQSFKIIDSLGSIALPRAVGNILGDNIPEFLLGGSFNNIYLFKPNSHHPVFGDLLFSDTTSGTLYPTSLADIDADGKDELIGLATNKVGSVYQSQYEVDKISGSTRILLGILQNPTAPAPHYAVNNYTVPDTRSADLLGDGKKEIVILDDDADLLIYKFNPTSTNKFDTIYIDRNDGYTEGRNVTIGDFNNDGKPDIAFAYHTSYDVNDDNEYDPSYWTLKVLLNKGGGVFTPIPAEKFYLARSLSPYRSSIGTVHDVTGAGGDDLVLSFFPNFYLLQFDISSQTMKPLWQYPVANSPRAALAFDFDGNGKREFGFDAGDSIHFYERDLDVASQSPAPAGLEVIPRDTDRVDLHWAPVSGASMYYILRADNTPSSQYAIIDSAPAASFTDSTVENGASYIYSVGSFDTSYPQPLSSPAPGITAFVHPKPRFTAPVSLKNLLTLHSTQPISTTGLTGGEFVIDDSLSVSTAIISADSSVVLTLYTLPAPNFGHSVRVRSFNVRDIWNSPFDTIQKIKWTQGSDELSPNFYITHWQFEGSTRITVEFSLRPDDNALTISNYELTPFGTVRSVSRDGVNDSIIFLDLSATTDFSPIGTSFVLCAHHITSGNLQLNEATSCIGETPTASSLDHLFVFPNPAKQTDESLTFAGLTAQASITIYSQDMHLLKRLSTTDHTGGVRWDLRDENGKLLPSGVYLYHVSGKDDNGNDVKPAEAKFVIVRN